MDATKYLHIIAFSIFMCYANISAVAQDTKNIESDNTEINTRDRNQTERTADQAKNNLSDRKIMQKIRKSIIQDKSLSTYAHNVKIISKGGKVTLKGPVKNESEKKNIKNKAVAIAGENNVLDELSISE